MNRLNPRPAPYDEFSDAYAAHAASNPYQALYDRPAILALAGAVAGKQVLDVGCAAGHLSSNLADAGARVIGLDLSQGMIDRARRMFGDRIRFECADLREPLAFLESESVDVITASLVLHYLLDWGATLGEFRRVLRSGGLLVMSVHHPEDWHWFDRPNYFRTEQVTDEFELVGQPHRVQFYRRPLSETFKALRQAGFAIDEIAEPMPLPECRDVAPDAHENLSTKPRFLYFRAINQ
jgi:SAM-dependent methyltransferase